MNEPFLRANRDRWAGIGAGLRIEFLHEFPYCICGILPGMTPGADGWWRLPEGGGNIPLLFSLRAVKPVSVLEPASLLAAGSTASKLAG